MEDEDKEEKPKTKKVVGREREERSGCSQNVVDMKITYIYTGSNVNYKLQLHRYNGQLCKVVIMYIYTGRNVNYKLQLHRYNGQSQLCKVVIMYMYVQLERVIFIMCGF